MHADGRTLSVLSIAAYFVLNLFVTVTSKRLNPQIQSAWLLTASHAITTLLVTSLLSSLGIYRSRLGRLRTTNGGEGNGATVEEHDQRNMRAFDLHEDLLKNLHILIPFSILYTINIVVSNWTLGLVSLTMHQTIRATVPAITIAMSILIRQNSWRQYSCGIYGAIALTICGVLCAIQSVAPEHRDGSFAVVTSSLPGLVWTLLGAFLAVSKTIASNHLQLASYQSRWSLGITSSVLVQHCSLCAIALSILIASWNGDFKGLTSRLKSAAASRGSEWLWLWAANALAASLLNIASFEAVKRCGPLSMGVAGNLKQVAILVLDFSPRNGQGALISTDSGLGVSVGAAITVIGGIWYAFAKSRSDQRSRRPWNEDGLSSSKQHRDV